MTTKLTVQNLDALADEKIKAALKPFATALRDSFARVEELRAEIASHDYLNAEAEFTAKHQAALNGDPTAAEELSTMDLRKYVAKHATLAAYAEGRLGKHNETVRQLFVDACTAARSAAQEVCAIAQKQCQAFADGTGEPVASSPWAATRGREIIEWTSLVIEGSQIADSSPIKAYI